MFPNAIAWAHYQLRGGLRNALTLAGIYAFLAIGFDLLISATNGHGFPSASLLMTLFAVQTASLLLFGAARLGGAIRLDVADHMIESHRLMPVAPHEAIVGYLVGGAATPLVIFVTGLLVGVGLSTASGLPVDRWLMGNLQLLVTATCFWCFVAMNSFGTRGGGNRRQAGFGWLGFLSIFGFTGGGALLIFVPPLLILAAPVIGTFVGGVTGSNPLSGETYGISLLAQLSIGAICFDGATRRYRSDLARGLTPATGLLLLVIWSLLSIYGIVYWSVAALPFYQQMARDFSNQRLAAVQAIVTTSLGACIALLPAVVALQADAAADIRSSLDPTVRASWLRATPLGIAASVAILWLIPFASGLAGAEQGRDFLLRKAGFGDRAAALTITLLVTASFIVTCTGILRSYTRRGARGGSWMIFLYIVVFVGGPVVADTIRAMNDPMPRDSPLTRLAMVSPVACLCGSWASGVADPMPGTLVQLAVAGLAAVVLNRRVRVPPDISAVSLSAG